MRVAVCSRLLRRQLRGSLCGVPGDSLLPVLLWQEMTRRLKLASIPRRQGRAHGGMLGASLAFHSQDLTQPPALLVSSTPYGYVFTILNSHFPILKNLCLKYCPVLTLSMKVYCNPYGQINSYFFIRKSLRSILN